jgi:hypothetical protein
MKHGDRVQVRVRDDKLIPATFIQAGLQFGAEAATVRFDSGLTTTWPLNRVTKEAS